MTVDKAKDEIIEHLTSSIIEEARTRDPRPRLDVSNQADAFDVLLPLLGHGPLSGLYLRNGLFVHCPRIGEEGYVPPADSRAGDGPAQVREVTPVKLKTVVQQRMYPKVDVLVDKKTNRWEEVHEVCPAVIAQMAVDAAPDQEHVPVIDMTTHTPLMRPDGTILSAPGYDADARVLYLPEPGLVVNEPPARMTEKHVAKACAFLEYLVQDFPFERPEHRANYLAYLLTPVMRLMVPPPYPMFFFNAHQPGSGKTLLTQVARAIHGGVHRPELPQDDDELRKQITGVLATTTAPLVIWDNADKIVRSPILAGLLTEVEWNDRLLGKNSDINARNDRLWATTGNNLAIGGDMARRQMLISIDPRMERPQERTGFAVPDLVGFVNEHRGAVLASLLVLVRAWVERGRPVMEIRSDSYGAWAGSIAEILQPIDSGAMAEAFASQNTEGETVLSDDDAELATFLEALDEVFGAGRFQGAAVQDQVLSGRLHTDALPAPVSAVWARSGSVARSVGKYLSKYEKRAAGGRRITGEEGRGGAVWRVERL